MLSFTLTHLELQVVNDAGDAEADQEYVGEDERSGGVDNLLDLFARGAGLTGLSDRRKVKETLIILEFYGVNAYRPQPRRIWLKFKMAAAAFEA